MANVDSKDLGVGRLYAEAILNVAEEGGQGDALLEELNGLVAYLDRNADLERFFSSPLVEEDARTRVIEEAFRGKASDLLVDSLQVISRKGRLNALRGIAEAYRIAYRDRRGIMDVHVRSAVPLSEAQRAQLTAALASSTQRTPALIEKVDPSLLGGMVIEIEGRKIDASVASRLHHLSEALLFRASREIHRGSTAYVAES
jgi:F-type H+-transporting ATPase subunit delta